MNKIIKCIWIFIPLLYITKPGKSQRLNSFQSSGAAILQEIGNTRTESRLDEAIITLSNNTDQLKVRLRIPYNLINHQPEEDTIFSSPGLAFNLRININSWQIQDNLTSGRTYDTQGFLKLNNISKPVMIEYAALPAGSEQNGKFNLSMIIQFNPAEFNLNEQQTNARWIINISDAAVNRL